MKIRIKILVIEDEVPIRRFLRASLAEDDFELHEAETGTEGIRLAASHNPDIILLDLGLPDIDGIEVTKRLREWSAKPIIVLSARGNEDDKIAALDNGANDYLTKPFGVGELLARIRVALRSSQMVTGQSMPVIEAGGLKIDLSARIVKKHGNEVHLTPIEYKVLVALLKDAGRVITHKQLLTDVWGVAYSKETHYLRVVMKNLRHKLEDDPTQPRHFVTEAGVGYRFQIEARR